MSTKPCGCIEISDTMSFRCPAHSIINVVSNSGGDDDGTPIRLACDEGQVSKVLEPSETDLATLCTLSARSDTTQEIWAYVRDQVLEAAASAIESTVHDSFGVWSADNPSRETKRSMAIRLRAMKGKP